MRYLLFFLFTWLLGNPILALVLVLVFYLVIDRTYFGFVPAPLSVFKRAARIRELRRIIAVNPHDARALKELGIFMVERGRFSEALACFRRAEHKMSDDPEFVYYQGLSLARSGDIAKGRPLVDSALQRAPGLKYGEPYLAMAEMYIDYGDCRSALPLLEHFVKIHYSSSRGLYRLGSVQLKLGMKDEGVRSLRKSVEVFKEAPRYKRKEDRKWAWKARMLLLKGR